jgi:hypothetical protein
MMKKEKKDKKDKKKIKGGFSLFSSKDFYPSAITLNGLRYLSWNNIPIGTLVILTIEDNSIWIVVSDPLTKSDPITDNDPRFGPKYLLINIKDRTLKRRFTSYDFRVLVVMCGATYYNTNKRIDDEFFYGIISGISEDTQNLCIMSIANKVANHLLFNIYNNSINSEIIDNNVRIMTIYDIEEAEKWTGISLDNFIGRIIGHTHEDKILNLKITRNGQWEISNIYKSSQLPNVGVFGGPTQPPFGAFGGPTQPPFGASGGPTQPPFGASGGPTQPPFGASGGPNAFDRNAFDGTFGASRESSPIDELPSFEHGAFGPSAFFDGTFGASRESSPINEQQPFGTGAFGGPTSQPFGTGAFGGPTSQPFGTGAFGGPTSQPFGTGAFGGPTSQPFGTGAFGGPKSQPSGTGAFGGPAFGGPAFGGPTSPPFGTGAFGGPAFGGPAFGGPAFGGPKSQPSGTGAFGGPTSPPFGTGAFGGPAFGGPAFGFEGFGQGSPRFGQGSPRFGQGSPPFGQGSPPFGQGSPPFGQGSPPFGQGSPPFGTGAFGGPAFGGPTSQSKYVEMAANIIIKHYFNNANDLTTTDFKNLSEKPGKHAIIIKNKMMGNTLYEDKDFKLLDRKAIRALHPNKFDKDLIYNNIINGENKKIITDEIFLKAVDIVINVLNDIRNPKAYTSTEANPPPKREPSPQRKPSSPPKREPSPQRKPSSPPKREPSPQRKPSSPPKREPPPQPNTNPSNDVEVAINNIIKKFFNNAIYITTEDLLKLFKEPKFFADGIQVKIMGNKRPVDQSVYKQNFKKAIVKLHSDKRKNDATINFFHDIINNKNITRENLDDAVEKVYRILSLIQQYKSTEGGGKTSLYKKVYKKEILGKSIVIYKISGSNKEYIKNKGQYVLATEYKKSKK